MMKLVFLLASVTAAMASGSGGNGYSGSFSSGNGQGYGGSFSSGNGQGYGGSFSPGNGQGYGGSFSSGNGQGYGGSFSSGNGQGYGGSFGAGGGAPFPGAPPFDFNNVFSQYFDVFKNFGNELSKNLQETQNAVISGSFGGPAGHSTFGGGGGGYGGGFSNSGGSGGSKGGYGGGFSGYGGPGGSQGPAFTGGYGGGFSNFGGQGAAASGSVGPGGVHQTAAVYPQNPHAPNVDTRFGGSPEGGGGYGVFTSSQSVSSNVNGKPVTYHKASTTVNDNGKISTYTVHNP